jgi:hypothetical protein
VSRPRSNLSFLSSTMYTSWYCRAGFQFIFATRHRVKVGVINSSSVHLMYFYLQTVLRLDLPLNHMSLSSYTAPNRFAGALPRVSAPLQYIHPLTVPPQPTPSPPPPQSPLLFHSSTFHSQAFASEMDDQGKSDYSSTIKFLRGLLTFTK